MHTVLFPREPAPVCESIIAYIDLETNSLDVLSGKIVEIGALVDGSRATFSTVVHPGHDAPLDDAPVHGIPREELLLVLERAHSREKMAFVASMSSRD